MTTKQTAMILITLAFACCSCAGKRGGVHPVRGKVFYEGRPAHKAVVYFHPLDDANKSPSVRPTGTVDEEGSFRLTTHSANDGAPAGRYAVTVVWLAPAQVGDRDMASLLPARYASPDTSQLTAEVQEGSNELEPFRLTR